MCVAVGVGVGVRVAVGVGVGVRVAVGVGVGVGVRVGVAVGHEHVPEFPENLTLTVGDVVLTTVILSPGSTHMSGIGPAHNGSKPATLTRYVVQNDGERLS